MLATINPSVRRPPVHQRIRKLRKLRPQLVQLLEDAAVARKEAIVLPLEREMAREVALWFIQQGKQMVRTLARLQPELDRLQRRRGEQAADSAIAFNESLSEQLSRSDWEYLVNGVMAGNHPGGIGALRELIEGYRGTAYLEGSKVTGTQFGGVGIGFGISSREAREYAARSAAAQVTRINDTTRESLNRLMRDAVDNGWGWQRTAKAIEEKFADFAGPPLFPSKKFRSRAQMIAAFEIGDAYEAGSYAAIEQQRATGAEFEKAWLNAGDERVRPQHRENASTGFIPMDDPFPGDNVLRPPTDPGCRCTLTFKQIRSAQAGPSAEAARNEILRIQAQHESELAQQQEALDVAQLDRDRLAETMVRRIDRMRLSGLTNEQVMATAEIREADALLQLMDGRLAALRQTQQRLQDEILQQMREALKVDDPSTLAINVSVDVWQNLKPGGRQVLENAIDTWRNLVSARVLAKEAADGISNNVVTIFRTSEGRAFFSAGDVNLARGSGSRTVVHELGHAIEYYNPAVLARAQAFLDERTQGDSLQPLSQAMGMEFRSDEVTRKDRFINPYMGKDYGGEATEIVSMGVEYLAYEPYTFAKEDPEYFRFIYNLLRGR